jgi:hypothetical protein
MMSMLHVYGFSIGTLNPFGDTMNLEPAPSIRAVQAFLRSEEGSLSRVIKTFTERGLLLSAGYYLFADKETALKYGFLGSAVIELYLVYHYSKQLT